MKFTQIRHFGLQKKYILYALLSITFLTILVLAHSAIHEKNQTKLKENLAAFTSNSTDCKVFMEKFANKNLDEKKANSDLIFYKYQCSKTNKDFDRAIQYLKEYQLNTVENKLATTRPLNTSLALQELEALKAQSTKAIPHEKKVEGKQPDGSYAGP